MMPVVRICAGRNWQPLGDLRSCMRRAEALSDRRRTGNDVAAAKREHAPCLGKRRVMADQQSDTSNRRVDDGPSVARGGPAPHLPLQTPISKIQIAVSRSHLTHPPFTHYILY